MNRFIRILPVGRPALAGVLLLAALGCNPSGPGKPSAALTPPKFDPASFPALAPPRPIESGVVVHQVDVGLNPIWVYLPAKQAAAGTLPCVLIAPAGTPLIFGINLNEGDRPEHLPYVRAGF